MAQTGFAGGSAGASPLQEVGGRTKGCQGVNHQSIVGVEEEGDALLPTQIGNIHLQVEEKQVLTSRHSRPSKSSPSCGKGMCQKGCRHCAKSLAGDLQLRQSRTYHAAVH